MCRLLSDRKSNSTLGPIASIGILFAMLSALTFLPAVLYVFGRAAFWPRSPHVDPSAAESEQTLEDHWAWGSVAKAVYRRQRPYWGITALVSAIRYGMCA